MIQRVIIFIFWMSLFLCPHEAKAIPIFGFDDITMGETDLKKILSIYPQATVRKFNDGKNFPELFVWTAKIVEIADQGIKILMRRNRRLGKHFLDVIYLNEKFKARTEDGIGIGSNYFEITKSFGLNAITCVYEQRSMLIYYGAKNSKIEGMFSLTFGCNNYAADSSNFVVDFIVLS